MKKIFLSICISALCGASMTTLQSCGDELKAYPWIVDDTEEDDGGGANDMETLERELRGAIPFMLNYSHEPTGTWAPHKYQYYRTNTIDNYAGYWTTTKANFQFGSPLPTLYTENNGYLGGGMDIQMFTQSYNAIKYAADMKDPETGESVGRPEWRAIALIIQAYLGHEIVDFYGVAAFNDWRDKKRTYPINYEAGPEVYKQILADLDEAIATLKTRQPSAADLQRVEGTDLNKTCTGWNWVYWVKFANSLKLRLAINMASYVDPDPVYGPDSKPFVAKAIAEEAVADEIGVLLSTDDRDIAYYSNGTWTSCVYFISNEWNDIRLCASLENILKHFKSPLLNAWFDMNAYRITNKIGVAVPDGIYGVRVGLMMEDTSTPDKGGYGPFAALSARQRYMPQPFLKRTEVIFNRAEGALRGWNMGGDYESLYREGIELSLREWDIDDAAIQEYLAQEELPAVRYIDGYNRGNDIDGRVTCGVKLLPSDTKEQILEKIISQKYIANWPMGAEAWTTFRRTGYPRLFPVKFNNMQNVDTELQIRRMSITRTPNNGQEVDQITELLGGTQDCGTHVFWDVNSSTWGRDENGFVIPDNKL